jgi:two-component system, LuxR family, response regulator FixJ
MRGRSDDGPPRLPARNRLDTLDRICVEEPCLMPKLDVVYLLDDDESVLKMLCGLIDTIGVEARPFASSQEFLAAYAPSPCECLVSDVRMPGIGGLQLQRALLAKGATLPIIFVTGYAEVGAAVEAMKNGAFDFIEKPFGAQDLIDKVQRALERSRELNALQLKQSAEQARLALLTPKERAVVKLVVEGKSSREISESLGISVRTVENHRAHIMDKLHVGSTVELVRLFL